MRLVREITLFSVLRRSIENRSTVTAEHFLLFVSNVHSQSILLVCRSVSDSVIDALADNCPDIEQVDVLGTSLVHEDSIRR